MELFAQPVHGTGIRNILWKSITNQQVQLYNYTIGEHYP